MEKVDLLINKITNTLSEIQKIFRESKITEKIENLKYVSKVLNSARQEIDSQQGQINVAVYKILYGERFEKRKKAPTQEKITRFLVLHPEGLTIEDLYNHVQGCYKLSKGAVRLALTRMANKGIVKLEDNHVVLKTN